MNYYKKLLKLEDQGQVIIDISHRGGNYGVRAEVFNQEFLDGGQELNFNLVPSKMGVFCNYLGGGIRGSITGGGYDEDLSNDIKTAIEKFTEACKNRYQEIENGAGLNSDYPDGSTNWNAEATKRARNTGVVSAY